VNSYNLFFIQIRNDSIEEEDDVDNDSGKGSNSVSFKFSIKVNYTYFKENIIYAVSSFKSYYTQEQYIGRKEWISLENHWARKAQIYMKNF
jgi:predicted ATP-dependent Lon-type protease